MHTDSKTEGQSQTPLEKRIVRYWRTLPAQSFDARLKAEVHDWLQGLSSTSPEWRSAIAGDAASAIGIALRLWPLGTLWPITDIAMTILLAAAFKDAAAANVLSTALKQIPISQRRRTALSKSWALHQAILAGFASPVALSPRQQRRTS